MNSYMANYSINNSSNSISNNNINNKRKFNNNLTSNISTNLSTHSSSNASLDRLNMNDQNNNKSNKKRFVWPDGLHKDFISAVFDYGLKHANSSDILALLPDNITNVNEANIRSHMLRFQQFRRTMPFNSVDNITDKTISTDNNTYSYNNLPTNLTTNHTNDSNNQLSNQLINKIKHLSNAIALQTNYINLLKQSVNKQIVIQNKLYSKLEIIDPIYSNIDKDRINDVSINELMDSYIPIQIDRSIDKSIDVQTDRQADKHTDKQLDRRIDNNEDYNKSETQMVNEMISLSNLHQMLLNRKNDQLSIHTRITNNDINTQYYHSANAIDDTIVNTNDSFELFDDMDLFAFLETDENR